MKTKKRVITGLLALTFATGTYVLTGCDQTGNEDTMPETEYSIKYYLNGGTNDSSNPETYKASDETFSLKDATKEGYAFAGWYEEATFETQITAINQGDKGHLKLYAKFVPHTYTITYDLAGGELSKPNPSTYDITSETISINNPTRTGYTFVGWKDEETGVVIQYRKILKGSMGNKSFTAQWELTTYDITAISNYGEIKIADGANHGDEITFEIEPNAGYEVVEIRINEEGMPANTRSFTMPGEDVTIEVVYKATEYTITYNMDGGVNNPANKTTYDIETADFEILIPTKEGYHFMGWRDESTQQVSQSFEIVRGTAENKTYTALWSVNSYYITYTSEHGTIVVPYSAEYGSLVEFTVYPDMGYTLVQILVNDVPIDRTIRSFEMPAEDLDMVFVFEKDVYTIDYVLNGGENDGKNPSTFTVHDSLNIYAPTKDGYVFDGWYTDENYINQFTGGYMAENLTLYAKFIQARIDNNDYETLQEAVDAAEEGDIIQVLPNIKIDDTIRINKAITLRGSDSLVRPSNTFNAAAMFIVKDNVYLEGLNLDAEGKAIVVVASDGHLVLNTTDVTGGYSDSYVSGVFVTGDAEFTMYGGSIKGNTIAQRDDYLMYATDLWIGSGANGIVIVIDGGAEIGNVFINSNSYKTETGGIFRLVDGVVENVYVEYDDGEFAVFDYMGGSVENLMISTTELGTYVTITDPTPGVYKGGHTIFVNDLAYDNLAEAINAAQPGNTVKVMGKVEIDSKIILNKSLVIVGEEDGSIVASENFANSVMFVTEGDTTNIKFENIELDGNGKAIVIYEPAGHLTLQDTDVKGGYSSSYVSGVYVSGNSTFAMHGGSIVGNTIAHREDYLRYATDLWIGSQANGVVATVTEDARIGNVFINSNSYKTETGGIFQLDGGRINNVYVEYDDEEFAVFDYISGDVRNLMISTAQTGTYVTLTTPETGVYRGGHTIYSGEKTYVNLADAITAAQDGDTVVVMGETEIESPITINKTITIVGDNANIKAADDFEGTDMFVVEGTSKNVTFKDITIDGNNMARVIKVNSSHVSLENTHVTGGYSTAYSSGVYLTGASTIEINGGSIKENTIDQRNNHLMYATDLWVESSVNGVAAVVDNDAVIGDVFVNPSENATEEDGIFQLVSGSINNIYVEYSNEHSGVFDYVGGTVEVMRLSTTETGAWGEDQSPVADLYKGGYTIFSNNLFYKSLESAIASANNGSEIAFIGDVKLTGKIILNKSLTIDGEGYTIYASDDFKNSVMFVIEGADTNITFRDVTIDAKKKAIVIYETAGHLCLEDTHVTGGYSNSYISGVYVSGMSTFEMHGGSIKGNTIAPREDYLKYATDLWIGSQANGTVAVLYDDAEIGSVFVNANSYKTLEGGRLYVNGAIIEDVYVEYDDERNAVFVLEQGTITTIRVSTTTTGEYTTFTGEDIKPGVYSGGIGYNIK